MTRHVQVRLEDEEYDRLDKAAEREGLKLQGFTRKALLEYTDIAREPSPFGDLTREESKVLRAVLRYLREQRPEDTFRQMLLGLPKLLGPHRE